MPVLDSRRADEVGVRRSPWGEYGVGRLALQRERGDGPKDAAPAGGQLGRVRRVARDVDRRVAERAELVALGREILPAYDEAVRPGSRVELHEARAVGEYPRRARDVVAHRVADGGVAGLAP